MIAESRLLKRIKCYDLGNEIVGKHIMIQLLDIDESFWFTSETDAQLFVTDLARELFYDKELRKGYFDYLDCYGETHRYILKDVSRGKIKEWEEVVLV